MKTNNFRRFSWRRWVFPLDWAFAGFGALQTCAVLIAQIEPSAGDMAEAHTAAGSKDVRFTQSAPYGAESELMRHLGYTLAVPQYDLQREKFRIIVPPLEPLSTNSTLGLLVWISPGEDPRIPPAWEAELAKHRLLFVSAYNAGNERHAIQRCRLALDATCNVCRRFKVDPRRIYVGGFSGGGRIASILGVAYADVFAGTLSICGVDFYRNVAGTGGGFPCHLPARSSRAPPRQGRRPFRAADGREGRKPREH